MQTRPQIPTASKAENSYTWLSEPASQERQRPLLEEFGKEKQV